MKQLIGIGKIAICGIIATILLSSIVYADEEAKAESKAIADANYGGEATSLVNTVVSTFPDGNGYITTAVASVNLKAIGRSDAHGDASGEGTSPVDPNGEQASASVNIDGNALAYDDSSSARLFGDAVASASTEDLTADARADLDTYAIGNAEAYGTVGACAKIDPSIPEECADGGILE